MASGFVATGSALHVPNAVRSRVTSRTAERRAASRKRAACRSGRRRRARIRSISLRLRALEARGGTAWRVGAEAMGGTIADPDESLPIPGATISTMSQRPTIRIPRWIQLVGLPVLLLVAWALAGTLGHAIFLFLTASVIAFLLNPLVRALQGLRIRRGIGVAVVFLWFRGCDDRGHRRAGHGRRRADALGGRPGRRLPYGRARTQRRQRLRPRRRGSGVLAATTAASTSSSASRWTSGIADVRRLRATRRRRSRSPGAPRSASSSCSSRSS